MTKESLFRVRTEGTPDRLISAKNAASVHKHLLGNVQIEKVTDPMTVASLMTSLNASGGALEYADPALEPTPLEVAIEKDKAK